MITDSEVAELSVLLSSGFFIELSDLLSSGFCAYKVVTALARTQRLGGLQKGDRSTMTEADKLLEQVIKGDKWLERKQSDDTSGESASNFDRVIRDLPEIRHSHELVDYVTNLRQILDAVQKKGTAPNEEIEKVQRFFFNYAKAVFERRRQLWHQFASMAT